MITIKIYSKSYAPIATFFQKEVDSIEYRKTLNRIGDCSFTLRIDNEKVDDTVLQHYNRVEILDDGVSKFFGYIVLKDINLDIVSIRCKSLIALWDKRIRQGEYATNGALDAVVPTLITDVNTAEDTGISEGSILVETTVNKVFNNATSLAILETLIKATGSQYEVDSTRNLNVKNQIGVDLSETVIFQYNVNQVKSSNILSFSVRDDGETIVTTAHGKSDPRTSTKEDIALKAKFGLIEKFKDFRVANSQNDLDDFTDVEVRPNSFSPDIQLNPEVADNFDVGDTVRVILNNKLIDIDTSYQILEKTVQYLGAQRRITVRISDLPTEFIEQIDEVNTRLQLLEENT